MKYKLSEIMDLIGGGTPKTSKEVRDKYKSNKKRGKYNK